MLPNFYSTSRYSSLVSGAGGGSFIGSAGVGDSSRAHTIKLDEPDSVRDVGGVTSQQEASSIYQSSSSTGTPSTVLAAGTAAVGEDDATRGSERPASERIMWFPRSRTDH
ncbi:unnamed protein product [Anisakis simplex]|uniref:Uncharacterized protein n=1 Tax=Anisakis simplex TaxID=6269 RepID=A0A3P6PG46_ANISI|nr:unnamed protein product [Anisakis simplex]